MKINFPFTISNSGEKLTFLKSYIKDGVEVIEGIAEVQPQAGPPMHVHYQQDESFEIVSGRMAYQILGEEPKYAYPGDYVFIKAGIPHKFWNAGDDLLVAKGFITPPGNFIYFLSEIYKSINENKGRPGMYDAAYLLNRYKSEYGMNEIPSFVQKYIFPVTLFFGNLFGKSKKFKDAPAPIV
jgi:quercetin dioxygenase-like cupin family protein